MITHIIAAILIVLLLAAGWWWEGRQDAAGKGDGWLLAMVLVLLLLGIVFTLFVLGKGRVQDQINHPRASHEIQ